jgi:hypothetical protein
MSWLDGFPLDFAHDNKLAAINPAQPPVVCLTWEPV